MRRIWNLMLLFIVCSILSSYVFVHTTDSLMLYFILFRILLNLLNFLNWCHYCMCILIVITLSPWRLWRCSFRMLMKQILFLLNFTVFICRLFLRCKCFFWTNNPFAIIIGEFMRCSTANGWRRFMITDGLSILCRCNTGMWSSGLLIL